ncbi:glycosyltransferase family 2 protein [Erythrobacter litoralis]|uniref:Putative dolichol-phosphate mannosyltransferase n=1 Tax=Erythrobacter litoralis (strain HTCC2594) TaxID=314225 RepID=Q2NDZ4_ERYLH|nr:glycosyltransferase family 2 protein [Erythrobacter litoralis]ABC62097.1 putative dolichol-phosphate mannosyltransferase [Erythrobacter litoralis HTCC2594]
MYAYKLDEFAQQAGRLDCAIIVPILNEAANIQPLIEKIGTVLTGYDAEIIFVDDGSTDGSLEILESIAAANRSIRVIRRIGRRGLSSAVVEGFLSTVAPVVAVMDGDLQHDESVLPAMIAALQSGEADLAYGSRYAGGGSVGDWAADRLMISNVATRMAGSVMKTPLSDPMSGFFAIRRELFLDIAPRLSQAGYKILLDIVASHPEPIRVKQVPYKFRTRTAGESKLDSMVVLEYVELLLEKLVGRLVPVKLLMFGAVGLVGTLVHLALLWGALTGLGASFAIAQGSATLGAMTFNFALNNVFTYRDRKLTGWRWVTGWLSFCAACGIGAVANVGIGTLLYTEAWSWWIAGLAGALIGSVWNYAATSWLTWRKR